MPHRCSGGPPGCQQPDGSWQLASGTAIVDTDGVEIAQPTRADILAQAAAEDQESPRIISVDIAGDLAPLFAPAYQPFFGNDVALTVEPVFSQDIAAGIVVGTPQAVLGLLSDPAGRATSGPEGAQEITLELRERLREPANSATIYDDALLAFTHSAGIDAPMLGVKLTNARPEEIAA